MLDVKVGSGAFMVSMEAARELARARSWRLPRRGLQNLGTDYRYEPTGQSAGNALEVIEVLETLTGTSVNEALWDVTAALGGEALYLAGLVPNMDAGVDMIDEAPEWPRGGAVRPDGGGAWRTA